MEKAPAKINLALHITGQRADGYHLLDSLVAFTTEGDVLTFAMAEQAEFSVSGSFAPLLSAEDASTNLVVKAYHLLRRHAQAAMQQQGHMHPLPEIAIHLEKNLPIASGIGGGSADAAACLRGLAKLWKLDLPAETLAQIGLALGADVPMCLKGQPLRATGIGETVQSLPHFPEFAIVLANPLKPVSTPAIFKSLTKRDHPPLDPMPLAKDQSAWLAYLGAQRNDLEQAARALCPEIASLSDMLTQSGADLVRMSGSGATCFGLYTAPEKAQQAASALKAQRPDWYFHASSL